MGNTYAPIALFVYKRPESTLRVLNALKNNPQSQASKLYIFCDGFKENDNASSIRKIEETRALVKSDKWCREVELVQHEKNKGLARSIIDGVTMVLRKHGQVIVLEDDIVPTPHFLQYMNDALQVYRNEKKVLSIGACNFFAHDERLPETFFIAIPDCWGWATWEDRWKLFSEDGAQLLRQLKEKHLLEKFNLYGRYGFEQMLVDQIMGVNHSWAIRWQAVAHVNNMLSLYPKYSVVSNIGNDNQATHGENTDISNAVKLASRQINVVRQPVVENPFVNKLMFRTYEKLFPGRRLSLFSSLKAKLGF